MKRQAVWQRCVSWWLSWLGSPNTVARPVRNDLDERSLENASSESGPLLAWTRSSMDPSGGSSDRGRDARGPGSAFGGADLAATIDHRSSSPAEILEDSEEVLSAYAIDDELEEFLAADRDPIAADPRFRDDLRERLWALVQDGLVTRPRNH